jgi:hypothetical protein
MPSKSQAQAHMMAGVAHGWKPDGMDAPPVEVAQEFNQADKGKNLKRLPAHATAAALKRHLRGMK